MSGLKRKGCPDNAGIDVRIAPVYAAPAGGLRQYAAGNVRNDRGYEPVTDSV